MHLKYEFHEFCGKFQLRARFENPKNYIKGEFGDILGPRKIPEFTLIRISDLKRQISTSISKIRNSRNSPYLYMKLVKNSKKMEIR